MALFPFLAKKCYYDFVCDRYLKEFSSMYFLGYAETINDLITSNKSFIRFGDELVDMLHGIGLYYADWHQKYDKRLAKRLAEIISATDEKLLIGLHWQFFTKTKEELRAIGMPPTIWTNSKVFLPKYLHAGQTYGSALSFQPKYNPQFDIKKILAYLKSKHVIVVTGLTERLQGLALGTTTDFVECPRSDSWGMYDGILARAKQVGARYKKDEVLFLVSLASPGKVLAYDLCKDGYQVWDTGQLFDLVFTEIEKESR